MNMRRKKVQRASLWLLASTIALGSAFPAYAADGAGGGNGASSAAVLSTGTAPAIGQVAITSTGNVELKNLYMMPEEGSKTVTFTLTVHNNGTSDLQFIDYWVRLRTKSGNQITVKVLPQDKEKNRITPKSSQDIGFYASVNESTELNDLIFDIIKWDFSQANFERTVGSIPVPEAYSIITEAGSAQTISMNGNPVSTSVEKVYVGKNEKNYTPTIKLNMKNTGSRSVAVPTYQYMIRTAEGYMYPLNPKGTKELTINPQTDKNIELTGSVPISLKVEGWQLVIVQNSTELKLNLPVAFFSLPPVSEPDSVGTGQTYDFTNKDGSYTAELNSVQRTPWEDQDILAATLTLGNKGTESLPLPNLTGYFMLDNNIKVEAKLIRTDKVIGLAAGGKLQYQFVGKVPYTYEFAKAKLVLQEKAADSGSGTGSGTGGSGTDAGTNEDLLEFVHSSELMSIPLNNVGETYKVTSVGRSASYKVRNVTTYTGDTSDTIAVQLEAVNAEKRSNAVPKLVTYFKAADGSVLPAANPEIKNRIIPGGSALLFLTTQVPKGFDADGLQLLIGDAITQDKLSEGKDAPDAYVNAVSFWLPDENKEVKTKAKDIEVGPYKLSMSKIHTRGDETGIQLYFDYELTKTLTGETNLEGRKLSIAIEDREDKAKFSWDMDLAKFEEQNTENGTDPLQNTEGQLKLGKKEKFKLSKNNREFIFMVSYLKDYDLKVYEIFNGQKKLLASQKITWFETTD
ncbi:hypothetical protein SAMN02799630_01418 [Paenibacillus sp. UNCCL117]|uniref:hypothetical protein n=1 Tax=unclassified Paenibacillus TaxID=185978 RepID=UPI000891B943|nr:MULTISPECIES: hypothetical protein [unclassified Paenibacillus]SDC76475.1 hypothetical protein SAMN04488602_103397 [Paenibacillus sp. cl123]SFW25595.1 hypothetical protein SAMN02799630_01418 [Paenibacillus sp. UNCCL117]